MDKIKQIFRSYKLWFLLAGLILLLLVTAIYQANKPLPENLNMAGEIHEVPARNIHFLADLSFTNRSGSRGVEQVIFDELFSMIEEAREFILLDFFLFNDFLGYASDQHRKLSGQLTELLIQQKLKHPDLTIIFISDPINNLYSSQPSQHFNRLRQAGIEVVLTDLRKIRDSNLLYSPFWRNFLQWFGTGTGGLLPNPFDPEGAGLSLRSYLKLLNFKANHRKVLVADSLIDGKNTFSTFITSANPHDGSSRHENVALRVDGFIWPDILRSEQAVLDFSGANLKLPLEEMIQADELTLEENNEQRASVQVLTERKIRRQLLNLLASLEQGDSVKMVHFYLSDQKIINALMAASAREVEVRIVLDPNKDAFGVEKPGIPNRPAAAVLHNKTDGEIEIRWCQTTGEQCHSKMTLVNRQGNYYLNLGSANLTRRNLGNYNLETNLLIFGSKEIPALLDAENYFNEIWNNKNQRSYTVPYSNYATESWLKKATYRTMEATGFCSF